ncbi:hypothetical protein LIER_40868 [Lithospermum erythrorhizon]|uniref:Uncharacterized protein n=1 Tax=Lithospermum erythrorhizon TaxID=34254 RepID=A0AAV3R117_LITER
MASYTKLEYSIMADMEKVSKRHLEEKDSDGGKLEGYNNIKRQGDLKVILSQGNEHAYGDTEHQGKDENNVTAKRVEFSFIVNPVGIVGGITVMWKEESLISIEHSAEWWVEAVVREERKNDWMSVFVYASCDYHVQKSQLDRLRGVVSPDSASWIVMGDFYDVLSKEEKERGLERTEDR